MPARVRNLVFFCIPCNQPFVLSHTLGPEPHEVRCPSGMHHVMIALPEGSRSVISALGSHSAADEVPPITAYPQLFWRNPVLVTVFLLGIFATIAAAYAAVAMLVHPLLCPLVFAATLATLWLFIILLLAINGNLQGTLIDSAFAKVAKFLSASFKSRLPSGHVEP